MKDNFLKNPQNSRPLKLKKKQKKKTQQTIMRIRPLLIETDARPLIEY